MNSSGEGVAIVENLNTVPLTAYLLQLFLEPCNPSPRPDVYLAVDIAQSPGAAPVLPSRARSEIIGAARCNKVGGSVPGRAELKAALFQDGSTFGDPAWVGALLESRRLELDEIESALETLRAPGAANAPGDVQSRLRAKLASLQTARKLPFAAPYDLGALVSSNLDMPGTPVADRIARTLNALEQLRNGLLQSRPPLR